MNRAMFLSELRMGLSGLPHSEIEEIVADYEAHFSEGLAAGRSEAAIANAAGRSGAAGARAEGRSRLPRWESERSAGSMFGAVIALLGLATLDLIFLIPFVCVIGGILLRMFATAVGLFFAGGAVWLLALFPGLMVFGATGMLGSGAGARAGGPGPDRRRGRAAALTWLLLDVFVRGLVQYARLHFRLLDSATNRERLICAPNSRSSPCPDSPFPPSAWEAPLRWAATLSATPFSAPISPASPICRVAIPRRSPWQPRPAAAWPGTAMTTAPPWPLPANVHYQAGSGDELVVKGDPEFVAHIRVKDGLVSLDCNGNFHFDKDDRIDVTLPGRRTFKTSPCWAPAMWN